MMSSTSSVPRRVGCASACLVASLTAVAFPRVAASAAPVTATLEAGWRAEQAGRPELRGPAPGVRLLSPKLAFAAADDRSRLDAMLLGRFESPRLPGSREFAPLARTAHSARLEAGYAWSPDGGVTVAGEHRQSRDRSITDGPLAAAPGMSGAWSAGGALWAGHGVEGSARVQGWSPDRDPAQRGEPDAGTAARWNVAVLPVRGGGEGALGLLLDWRERRFIAPSEPVAWTRAGLAGLRYDRSPELSIRAGAGLGATTSNGGRERRGAAGVVEIASPTGRPGPLTARAEFQAHFPTLANVAFRHRLGDGWLSASAESAMEVAGAPEVDRVLVRRLSFAVQETLWRATVLEAEASDVRSRALTLQRPIARAGRASLALTRRVRPWLQLGGRSSFLREWDVASAAAPPTRRVRLDTFLAVAL